jgi:DNA repair protein RecO (recombination protein O)
MRNKRDRIFVIKSINYSEADKIITVFGRERGKFTLLAKGVRKLTSKNRGNIQTFSVADISYYEGSGMPLLLETSQVATLDYSNIDTNNAQRVLQMLNRLTVDDAPNEKVFDALESIVLKGLTIEYVNKFRTIFLLVEGILSDLSICHICLSNEKLMVDKHNLESICESCILNGNLNRDRFIPANKDIYSNIEYTLVLDKYIKKVIEETT